MTKIAVTGDQGFIGFHFIETIKDNENFEIFPFDRVKYDFLNKASLAEFVKNKDFIVHFAGVISRENENDNMEGNLHITYKLISAIKEFNPKAKLIHLSSIQAETSFETIQGINKRLTDEMLELFSEKFNLSVGIFRLTNTFGENCRPFYNSVVATFCYQIVNGEEIKINPNDKKFNFIYVKDVIDIILDKVRHWPEGKLFFLERIDSTNELTISELADILKGLSNNVSYDMIKNQFNISEKFFNDLKATYQSYLNYKINPKYAKKIKT